MAKEIPIKIQDGKIIPQSDEFYNEIQRLEGKEAKLILKKVTKNRTSSQHRALHLWFELLAQELNEHGYDMKKFLRQEVDIPWSSYTVKENLWRPLQEERLKKKSTNDLNTDEVDKVFDILNKVIGERTGLYVPFPCIDSLLYEKNTPQNQGAN